MVLDICKNINRSVYESSVVGISSQKDMLKIFHENNIEAYALSNKKTINKFLSSVIQIKNHMEIYNKMEHYSIIIII